MTRYGTRGTNACSRPQDRTITKAAGRRPWLMSLHTAIGSGEVRVSASTLREEAAAMDDVGDFIAQKAEDLPLECPGRADLFRYADAFHQAAQVLLVGVALLARSA